MQFLGPDGQWLDARETAARRRSCPGSGNPDRLERWALKPCSPFGQTKVVYEPDENTSNGAPP